MAHRLILGVTESGKTTLAKVLARRRAQRNSQLLAGARWQAGQPRPDGYRPIGVLDPKRSAWPGADYSTPDPDEFLRAFYQSTLTDWFIDEPKNVRDFERWRLRLTQALTEGRHLGHSITIATHRGSGAHPDVRGACRFVAAFSLSAADGLALARETGQPMFERVGELRQLECIAWMRWGGLELLRVDPVRLDVTTLDLSRLQASAEGC